MFYWTLFAITLITTGPDAGDHKYTPINTFESRQACEISRAVHMVTWEDTEFKCFKTDEAV